MKQSIVIFSFVVALFNFASLSGQNPTVAEGRVIDNKTHAPIDYANIRFKGNLSGVHADSLGYFKISTSQKTKTLVVSSLGYQSAEVPIQSGAVNKNMVVELKSLDITLKEVVVKPGKGKKRREIDTTAMYVWHNVVIHKDQNKATQINNYY